MSTVVEPARVEAVNIGAHFQITESGLSVNGQPTFEQCEAMWSALRLMEKSLQFAIGDAIKYLEGRWGERAAQIIDAAGISFATARAYRWTATKVDESTRRMDVLTYSHHQAVAKLPPREQRRWLDRAAAPVDKQEGEAWPVARLKAAIKSNTDAEPTAFFVLVRCVTVEARDRLQARLEAEGYVCKATERHDDKEKV